MPKLLSIRTSGKNINLDGKKSNKSNFYKNKKLFKIDEPYGKKSSLKHSIGYNDNDVIRPL